MSLSKGIYHDESQLPPEKDRIALIHKAFDSGVTMLSTADLYGPYDNHVLIGKQSGRKLQADAPQTLSVPMHPRI